MIQTQKLRSTLENKLGFSKLTKKHENYKLQDRNGNFIIHTIISKGASGKDINKGILSAISRQLQLNSQQLESAIKCTLSREDYYDLLRKKGYNM
ncbi:TPA: type II toxin-antitoxin system HicA family toxin [bacterium]|jgi:hypothetical protein|nr:type II toxin-antitoxin system HicA family toxin [bacterium]